MTGAQSAQVAGEGLESIKFEHTDGKTVLMLKRYFQYFQRKLTLLGAQVADLCELIFKDETVRYKFDGETGGNTSLHHSLDKFLMGVLKGFLQNIDEGFADIIDELEDCCADDHYCQSILKRVIYEFQKNSFIKRQELTREYDEENEEMGTPSFDWFDSFFGDVTSLLKNPINRNAYQGQFSGKSNQMKGATLNSPQFFPVVSQAYPTWQTPQQVWNLYPPHESVDEQQEKTSKTSSIGLDWDKKLKNWGSADSLVEPKPNEGVNWQGISADVAKVDGSAKSSTLSKSEQPIDKDLVGLADPKIATQGFQTFIDFEDLFEREVFNIDQNPVYCVCPGDAKSILVATTNQKLYKYHTDKRELETLFDGS